MHPAHGAFPYAVFPLFRQEDHRPVFRPVVTAFSVGCRRQVSLDFAVVTVVDEQAESEEITFFQQKRKQISSGERDLVNVSARNFFERRFHVKYMKQLR